MGDEDIIPLFVTLDGERNGGVYASAENESNYYGQWGCWYPGNTIEQKVMWDFTYQRVRGMAVMSFYDPQWTLDEGNKLI